VKNFFQIIHLSPPNLATFAPWRESNSSVRVFQCSETFAQAAKILKDSSTKVMIKNPNLRGLRVLRGELSRRDAATSPNTEVESTPKRKKKGKTKHGSDNNGKTEITAQNDAGTGMPHRAELQ
jgi:hypothetical protein